MSEAAVLLTLDVGGDSNEAQGSLESLASVIDSLQEKIDSLNTSIQGNTGATDTNTSSMEASAGAAESNSAAVEKLGQSTEASGNQFREFGNILNETTEGSLGPLLRALSGPVGAIGALAGLGLIAANLDTDLMRMSATLGISAEKAHELSIAFEDVGSSGSSLIRAGVLLSNVLTQGADAITKGTEPSLRYRVITEQLGVAVRDTSGALRSQGDVLQDLLAHLGAMTNKTEAARLAAEIFGARFAQQLIPAITHWNEISGTAADQAKKLGDGLTNAEESAIQFHTVMTSLKTDVEAFAVQVLPGLIVALKVIEWPLDKAVKGFSLLRTGMNDLLEADAKALGPLGFLAKGVEYLWDPTKLLGKASKETADAINQEASAMTAGAQAAQYFGLRLSEAETAARDFNKPLENMDAALRKLASAPTPELLKLKASLAGVDQQLAATKEAYDNATYATKLSKEADQDKLDSLDRLLRKMHDTETEEQIIFDAATRRLSRKSDDATYERSYKQANQLIQNAKTYADVQAGAAKEEELTAARTEVMRQRRFEDQKTRQDKAIRDKEKEQRTVQDDVKGLDETQRHLDAERGVLEHNNQIWQDRIAKVSADIGALVANGEAIEAWRLHEQGAVGDMKALNDKIHEFLKLMSGDVPANLFTSFDNQFRNVFGVSPAGPFAGFTGGPSQPTSPSNLNLFGISPVGPYKIGDKTIGSRDSGGPVESGHPYLIGPQEIFVPRTPGTVYNSQQWVNQQKSMQVFGPVSIHHHYSSRSSGTSDGFEALRSL